MPRPPLSRARTVCRFASPPLLLVAVALLAIHGTLLVRPRVQAFTIDPAWITHTAGLEWKIDVPPAPRWFTSVGNTMGGRPSRLLLFEDGKLLVPGGCPGVAIQGEGAGRHCHWGSALCFSTSDGSDPRSSGRTYTATIDLDLWRGVWIAGAIAGVAGIAMFLVGFRREVRAALDAGLGLRAARIVFALAVIGTLAHGAALCWMVSPLGIAMSPDSDSYLNWYIARTPGYPLFLAAISGATGTMRWTAPIQMATSLAALVGLAWAFGRVTSRWCIAAALLLFVGTSPRLLVYAFYVHSEAPFIACIAMSLAFLCLAAGRDRLRWIGLASACLAAACIIRPAGYGLLPMLVVASWWMRGRRIRAMASAVVPAMLVFGAASAAQYLRHGQASQTKLGPPALAGYVAHLIRPENCPSEPELAARIAAVVTPVTAQWPVPSGSPLERLRQHYLSTVNDYNRLLYGGVWPELVREANARKARSPDDPTANDGVLAMRLSKDAIRAQPADFAWLVAAHVASAWAAIEGPTNTVRSTLNGWVQADPPLLSGRPVGEHPLFRDWWRRPTPQEIPPTSTIAERARGPIDRNGEWIARATLLLSLVGLGCVPWLARLGPSARILATASVGLHGYFVLVALTTVVITRYVDVVEPLVGLALAAALAWAIGAVRRRAHSLPQASATAATTT